MENLTITSEVSFVFECSDCGKPLEGSLADDNINSGGSISIDIEACEKCKDAVRSEAYEDGRDSGWWAGHSEGYDEGKADCECEE